MPIEYWIDLNICEHSGVAEILGELCHKFLEETCVYHISLITDRLMHLALMNEINFYLEDGGVRTSLSREEAILRLKSAQTWDVASERTLIP